MLIQEFKTKLNYKSMYRKIKKLNLKIFKDRANVDKKFIIPKRDRNTPYTVLPTQIYEDFDRQSYKRHTINFPMNLKYTVRRVPIPKDVLRYKRLSAIKPNFANLTGNELLLALKDHGDLTQEEKIDILLQLTRKKNVKKHNLEENELVSPIIKELLKNFSARKVDRMVELMNIFDGLGVKDEDTWEKIKRELIARIYGFEKISSTYFADFLVVMLNKVEFDDDELKLLFDQLGRHNRDMHPDSITRLFSLMVDQGHLTSPNDHLFERHFFYHFWQFPKKFGIHNYPEIIKGLKKLDFVKVDPEFFEYEFLPLLTEFLPKCDKVDILSSLLVELNDLPSYGLDQGVTRKYEDQVIERLTFLERKMEPVHRTEFVEIVREDIEMYKRLKLDGQIS